MTPKTIGAGILGTGALIMGGVDASVLNEQEISRVEIIADERVEAKQIGNVIETTLPWKDQAGIKVKYDMGEPTLAERVLDKRKKEVITETVSDFEGGFKVDILLNERPDTNVFCYAIEGAENYDFFYQPPLTPEEIANGDTRPPEIEGSYAVYHKTLANHRTGGENYATGKVMHIPRPQVWSMSDVDTKVWADMDYSNGNLCVTVPQDFLDTAKYPVRVDPTFGYTSIGGSRIVGYCSSGSGAQRIGKIFDVPESGTIQEIVIGASHSSVTDDADTALFLSYPNNVTNSHSQIASTSKRITYTSTGTFYTASTSNEEFYGGTKIISVVCDGTDVVSGNVAIHGDTGSTTLEYTELFGLGAGYTNAQENPWTIAGSVLSNMLSMYVTYTASEITNGSLQSNGVKGSDIGFCYQSGTAICFTGVLTSNARMGYRTGVDFGDITTGFRFVNIYIPNGSTIDSALFNYTAQDTDSSSAPTILIWGENVDNSPTFSTTSADRADTVAYGGSRATTSANVSWTLPNQTINIVSSSSPDISSIIQEIIDRPGWVSGNALSLIFSTSNRVDNFNAKSATSSAFLTITYTTGSSSPATSTAQTEFWFD